MELRPLSAKQRLASRSARYRINVWEGAVRSGKTFSSLIAWLRFTLEGPRGALAMVGKTERTVRHNVIDPLTEIFGPRRCRYVQGRGDLYLFGRRIYVVGANDERAEEKLRGKTLAGAYVDEASVLPESFWKMLLTRLSLEGARLFATTNPDAPMHWLKVGYLDRAALWVRGDGEVTQGEADVLNLARFSFRLVDNETLPAAVVEDMKRENTGLWHRRFILGEWVAAEGAVYDMLDIATGGRHVVSALPALQHLRLAIDYGTSNPTVALLLGISAEPRLYVAREWRYDSKGRRALTDAEYVERLAAWLQAGADRLVVDREGRAMPVFPEKIVVDPSAASFRAAWKQQFGRWPENADNVVLDGIRDTASLLSLDRLTFHESCSQAIAEHVGYVWDAKAQQRGEDAPLKVADHAPDALRYGVRSYRTIWRHWLGLPRTRSEAA